MRALVLLMVDTLGHLGMALLWLAPTWYFVDHGPTAALTVAGEVWLGLVPDVDRSLSRWFEGIHHHGGVHAALAVTQRPDLAAALPYSTRRIRSSSSDRNPSGSSASATAATASPVPRRTSTG